MSSLAIRPHPLAPLFSRDAEPELVLRQLCEEVERGNYPASEAFFQLLRQAGFVSLFFFLRYIASDGGPYDLLREDIHLDFANFRQSDACMAEGARGAGIVFRGFYKSSIGGHGANTWEILRNPDIRIRLVSAIVERAHDFKNISKNTFEACPLFKELYPEWVISKSSPGCNDNEFTVPNRTRKFAEPTMSAGGATGASEGIHVDLLCLDDIEGLDDLASDHKAAAGMAAKKKWFNTNATTLLVDKKSRIYLNGTIFGSDDIHSEILYKDLKELRGFQDPEFEPRPEGHWTAYYRSWKEDDKIVFPEVMDEERYATLLKKDPWAALTQYANKARDPINSEFFEMETGRHSLFWSTGQREWFIIPGGTKDNFSDEDLDGEARALRLGSLDTVLCIDPAGTEKGMTAKTSRTAIVVVSMDSEQRVYLNYCKAGFFNVFQWFDYLFDANKRFEGLIRLNGVEANAMQKILQPILQRERILRDHYIPLSPIIATGDKVGRIRSNVGRFLMRGLVSLAVGQERDFEEERLVFPQNDTFMDVLDAFEKALVALSPPESDEELAEEDLAEAEYELGWGRNRVTGY